MSNGAVRRRRIPLNHNLLSEITIAGEVARGGSKLTIGDRWSGHDNNHWLQLNLPGGKQASEACLRWVCKRYDGVYAVLEMIGSALEQDSTPAYFLVEVANRNTVRLLRTEELEYTLPFIQADIAGREVWSPDRKREVLFADIRSVFGEF